MNGTWQSLVNIFELSVYALTMILNQPQQFNILCFVSFFFVLGALVIIDVTSLILCHYFGLFHELYCYCIFLYHLLLFYDDIHFLSLSYRLFLSLAGKDFMGV